MDLLQGCIPANSDITGIGVRTAVYAQNLLSFVPALYALVDRKVTPTELESLETQSSTILITAFALLLSTIIQAFTSGLTNYHATVIMNLSWINNTNTFIYLLLYFYRRVDIAMGSNGDSYSEKSLYLNVWRAWMKEIRKVMRNPVLLIGSAHLSLMGAVGIWLWSQPTTFGANADTCSPLTHPSVVVFGTAISLASRGLQVWSLLLYSVVLIPGLNLVIPSLFFLSIFWLDHRFRTTRPFGRSIRPVIISLLLLTIAVVVLIADTEDAIVVNKALLESGDDSWTFGQTLSLLLLLVPLRDIGETIWERRPKELGKRLLHAAAKGELDVVRYLVELGAPVDVLDKIGRTPLARASAQYRDIVAFLWGNGAHLNVQDSRGRTPLMEAASKGSIDVLEFLIDKGVPLETQDKEGNTAVLCAAKQEQWEVLKSLAEHRASINVQDKDGYTPLSRAKMSENWEVVEHLVEHGADVSGKDPHGDPLLVCAAQAGKWATVQFLVEHDADVKSTDKHGLTAQAYAAKSANWDMVIYLINHGADANGTDPYDVPILVCAAEAGQSAAKVVRFLIEHGADVNDKGRRSSDPPLVRAAKEGRLETVQYLVEHGANVDGIDADKNTAILCSANAGNWKIVEYLVEKHANINVKDLFDRTLLILAAQDGQIDMIRLLIGRNVDVNYCTCEGMTALRVAAQNGHAECVLLLLGAGAKDIQDTPSAADVAEQEGYEDIAKLIHAHLRYPAISTNPVTLSDPFVEGGGDDAYEVSPFVFPDGWASSDPPLHLNPALEAHYDHDMPLPPIITVAPFPQHQLSSIREEL